MMYPSDVLVLLKPLSIITTEGIAFYFQVSCLQNVGAVVKLPRKVSWSVCM